MVTRLVLIAILLLANGFFVAAEFALVRARRTRLEAMARRGNWMARLALRAAQNLPQVLSATQIGVTVCSLGIGALAEGALGPYVLRWLGNLPLAAEVGVRVGIAAGVALVLVSYLQVVVGELVPRGLALRHPEEMAGWLAPPLTLFAWLMTPITWVLNRSAQVILRALGVKAPRRGENVHSAEELRMLVEQSEEGGMLLPQDAKLMEGVFEFSEKNAREVMTPRTDIDALPVEAGLEQALALLEETRRSRYPVFDDTIDNVVGLVLAKDMLPILHHPPATFSLRDIMRPVHVVPGSREVEEVLADFKRLKEHMAIVLDEYGGTAGLVTMEDLLEEIVGEILDEYDEPLPAEALQAGDLAIVPGSMNIGEFNERFALSVPETDYTTIGGFVFGALGRLPAIGDHVSAHGATFTVKQLDGRRIESLAVKVAGGGAKPEPAGG
ncbi:MAG TPA: hemolysin family protein [Gemmatimonadaceae bacterium]|jgi:CBS domain containing-hemolysin-like protein|nr:hemolysin family protein [Gemmatimonadaceae bacterium]